MFDPHTAQERPLPERKRRIACPFFALVALSACGASTTTVVAPSDVSGPTVSLSLEHDQQGQDSNGKLTLSSKTGKLNLVASATDNESGIQSLMIFADKAVTHCQGETCSGGSHPLLTNPTFQSTSPKKNPGEPMSPQSIMLQWIQLDTEIPQALPAAGSTRHIEWEISARAVNNYGMIANTPLFYASWSE